MLLLLLHASVFSRKLLDIMSLSVLLYCTLHFVLPWGACRAERRETGIRTVGVRVDPDLNAQSRMGHYRGLALVDFTPDLVVPAPAELRTLVRRRARACPWFWGTMLQAARAAQ